MSFFLRKLISFLLVEGKLDDLKKHFPAGDVEDVARNDPSGTKFKYTQWMLKQLQKGHGKEDVYSTVSYFDKNVVRFSQRDINAYADLKNLEDEAKKVSQTKSKRQQTVDVKSEAPKIYEDDDFVVIRPDTKRSCMVYGSNTKWCITMGDASYYEEYTSANVVFYFVLSKKRSNSDSLSKIAAAVMRNAKNNVRKIEWYDAVDNKLSEKKVKLHLGDKNETILNTVKSDAVKRPMGFLAKLKNGLATADEIMSALDSSNNNEQNAEVRVFIAKSKTTPPEALAQLVNDKNNDVRWAAIQNTATPPEILARLAKDEDNDVRLFVAQNTTTPPAALAHLAKDEDKDVRSTVAGNTSTPFEELVRLAKDEDKNVRKIVAGNSVLPTEVLTRLASDEVYDVRFAVGKNPATPPEALAYLANDIENNVRWAAAKNLATPSEALERLISDNALDIQMAAAGNTSMPPEVLARLGNSDSFNMRWKVAGNPTTPYQVLLRLAHDENVGVSRAAKNTLRQSKTESVVLIQKFINEALKV